ncbi:CAP domain-containing protein [Amnibacterium flavum]|uniref:SCP domain-containing protein n=1 Tax=Amnibacterium flavum TaxID=2173173 RepID=A0A2V1HR88_9MICO|nr:CAP domain-containing protein [Amnibacterium flavum]PVZ93629.1 hypothetical protein DDQ50_15100 [Amnibacterium flavum]
MQPGRRIRTLATTIVMVVIAAPLSLGGPASPAAAYDEDLIVQLANEARWADGQAGLIHNPALDTVAYDWAQQMGSSGALSHNPDVGAQIPGGWNAWGENVAQGYGSGQAVHDGWMNSSGHRANILGGYTDIGVALIDVNHLVGRAGVRALLGPCRPGRAGPGSGRAGTGSRSRPGSDHARPRGDPGRGASLSEPRTFTHVDGDLEVDPRREEVDDEFRVGIRDRIAGDRRGSSPPDRRAHAHRVPRRDRPDRLVRPDRAPGELRKGLASARSAT